jgi:hypothetical protein
MCLVFGVMGFLCHNQNSFATTAVKARSLPPFWVWQWLFLEIAGQFAMVVKNESYNARYMRRTCFGRLGRSGAGPGLAKKSAVSLGALSIGF